MSIRNYRSYPLVILGAGYTGKFLYPLATKQGWHTLATSRNPEQHLGHIPVAQQVQFDLLLTETWSHIPKGAHLIWCFPALPQETASVFVEQHIQSDTRLIVLGSTSAYGPSSNTPVNEKTPVDLTIPRVQSEEHLRKTYGAVILRLAGLYGPGRHVLDWIRRGKVKNTDRYVNLIHIEDVAGICLTALGSAKSGEIYIVSDGIPYRWSEIFSIAAQKWGTPLPPISSTHNPGKRLSIKKLQTGLHYKFRYPELYQALDRIEQQTL